MHQNGLLKAIRYFGSQAAIATAVGVSPRVISNWVNRAKSIPYQYVIRIYKLSNGNISLQELAPEQADLNPLIAQIIQNFTHHFRQTKP